MILLYGDEYLANRYLSFLNTAQHFNQDIFYINDLSKIPSGKQQQVVTNIIKIFLCVGEVSQDILEKELIDFGFKKEQITTLNETNKMLGYILYDMDYKTSDQHLLSSMISNFNDIQKVYSNFLIQKYGMKKQYDIAFSFVSKGHETHILDLSYALEKNYNILNIFSLDNNKYNLKNSINFDGNNVVLDVARIESLKNYDILISANAMHSEDAISVGVAHGINEKPTNRMHLFNEYIKCDYNFIQNKAIFETTKDILKEYQHLLKKEVCLVPFGYPKLDKVINDLKKYKDIKKDAICYAPTILMHDKEFKETLSLNDGVFIIGKLLKKFPDYKIIFRPHPKTIEYDAGKEYVELIIQEYGNHTNFIYDSDSYHIKTFSRTKLLISDFSGVAQTFAFSTLQPVLSLSKDGFDKHYKKVLKGKDIRKKFGLVLNDNSKLIKKVNYILNNQDKFVSKIKKYREKEMYNLGNTTQYLIDNIEYIKSGKKHPDWFYIGPKD